MDIDTATVAAGRRIAGNRAAVHRKDTLLADINATATAARIACGVVRDGAAVHGKARRVGLIRCADEEHTAAAAAGDRVAGNRAAVHGEGRAGLIVATIYTDLHAAGDGAAV